MVMARPATNPVMKPAAQVNRIKIVIARPSAAARAWLGRRGLSRQEKTRVRRRKVAGIFLVLQPAQRTALGSQSFEVPINDNDENNQDGRKYRGLVISHQVAPVRGG